MVYPIAGLWFAGKEGMEKNMETTILGYIRDTIRIDSFIPLTKDQIKPYKPK